MEANALQVQFFGAMQWIVIQRVTLPLVIFFHFHSAVVFMELFKEVFDEESDEEKEEEEV